MPKYDYNTFLNKRMLKVQFDKLKPVIDRLDKLNSDHISHNDEELINIFYDNLTSMRSEHQRIKS